MTTRKEKKAHADYMRAYRAKKMAEDPEGWLAKEREISRRKIAKRRRHYKRLKKLWQTRNLRRMRLRRRRLSPAEREKINAANRVRNAAYRLRHLKKYRRRKRLAERRYLREHPIRTRRRRRLRARRHYKKYAAKVLAKIKLYRKTAKGRMHRKLIANRRRHAKKRGTLTTVQWLAIVKSHKSCCHYCKRKLKAKQVTVDHMKPLSRRGRHDAENVVPACMRCNLLKGTKTVEEFKLVDTMVRCPRAECRSGSPAPASTYRRRTG